MKPSKRIEEIRDIYIEEYPNVDRIVITFEAIKKYLDEEWEKEQMKGQRIVQVNQVFGVMEDLSKE